jgi:hypothetical protein
MKKDVTVRVLVTDQKTGATHPEDVDACYMGDDLLLVWEWESKTDKEWIPGTRQFTVKKGMALLRDLSPGHCELTKLTVVRP